MPLGVGAVLGLIAAGAVILGVLASVLMRRAGPPGPKLDDIEQVGRISKDNLDGDDEQPWQQQQQPPPPQQQQRSGAYHEP